MNRFSWLLILNFWLFLFNPSLAQHRDKFSTAEVKADLIYLYQNLEASHYDLLGVTQ